MPLPVTSTGCANFRQATPWSRRELLRAGSVCGLALTLPALLQARAQAAPTRGTFGRAKSLIVLYLHGGHAQQETWDPKPEAPAETRGDFRPIATSVPGTHVCELLPHSARLMHHLAVIRSLSHPNANHVQAALAAMTGHSHPPEAESRGDFPPSAADFPPFGAVLDSLRPAGGLPTWVQVGPLMRRNNGTVLHGQQPGFLGPRYSPFVIDQDLLPSNVKVEAVAGDADLPALRLTERRGLVEQIDAQRRLLHRAADGQNFDAYRQRAFNLLSSPATARAFDLAAEPAALRERYGATQFGQCCLLARRLAEAGVPLINVHFCRTPEGSWDTHSRHAGLMKELLCPTFDRAFAALVADLEQRGLLESTLVLATAEFGRTPRINKSGGRDHWPWVYAVALAGGGTAGGVVYGSSDKMAAYPTSHPHDPADLAATVYHLLGVPADTQVYDQSRRPHGLIAGQKIDGLLA
jgi:uncharacterized protein (DUF1501 family)